MRICKCGCGQPTKIITHTHNKSGRIKGEYNEFITGHNSKGKNNPVRGKSRPDMFGANNIRWNGGKTQSEGYILITKPEHPFCQKSRGYVFEHRLVVEQQIGRYLSPEEQCHHINEIRDDNRPENLMAFVNASAHTRFHGNPNSVKSKEIIFDGRKLCKN